MLFMATVAVGVTRIVALDFRERGRQKHEPLEPAEGSPLKTDNLPTATKLPTATRDACSVGRVRMEIPWVGDSIQRDGNYLGICWLVTTDNDSKKYQFSGWDLLGVAAKDDQGNTYRQQIVQFPPATRAYIPPEMRLRFDELQKGAKGDKRGLDFNAHGRDLTSERALYGSVVFEMPVRAANKLTVTFKGDHLELGRDFVFEVPKELWSARKK